MNGKIHFLNTGSSDCILLESEGHFALIDAGEDSQYPPEKPYLNFRGYEEAVVAYLLAHCTGENGRVRLEFVLGTHAHSDHIGGFDTVIDHPLIDVGKAYLKPYHHENIFLFERIRWDNSEVYTQMAQALRRKQVPVIEKLDGEKITLGRLNIRFFNGNYRKRRLSYGENINSVVTLVEAGGTRALLAGDLNNKDGDESRLAPKIGPVHLLKVGHHGHPFSTSRRWLATLRPALAVVTNTAKHIFPTVRFRLNHTSRPRICSTVDANGIIAELYDNGEIRLEENGMKAPSPVKNKVM